MEKNIVLQLKNISKSFGKVHANKNISLDLYEGEILSLLGENGSGKTSLMNILSGIYFPDNGKILLDGKKITITCPKDAFKYKIGMVHQHFKLVDVFTATENVVLGLHKEDYEQFRQAAIDEAEANLAAAVSAGKDTSEELKALEEAKKSNGKFNLKESEKKISAICERYGFVLDLDKRVCDMSVSEKQTLEIIKVLYRGVDLLILDEPTAVLTPQEIDKLFKIVRKMKEDGKSIIIITHKLNEVMDISDRIAVLRKGELIGSVLKEETSIEELTEMMVGKKTDLNIKRSDPIGKETLLEVKHVYVKDFAGQTILKNINFSLKEGEILGVAGISGSGQKELLDAIAGVDSISKGEVVYHRLKKGKPLTLTHKSVDEIRRLSEIGAFVDYYGNPITFVKERLDTRLGIKRNVKMSAREIKRIVNKGEVYFRDNETMFLKGKNPQEIRDLGIHLAFVPEDRLGMGLVPGMSIADNVMLRTFRSGNTPFLNRKSPREVAERMVEDLEIATPSIDIQVKKLSGGNLQKVLVGREIEYSPTVFMVAYPVRGLDINSSYTIYNLLNKQKENGVGILYIGEDLDVLLELCDRILVLCNGEISGIVDARTTDKKTLGALMVGKSL